MGSSESTKRLTMERSRDEQNPGIIAVSERVVRRLRGDEELPLKSTDEISRDDINSLWQELQEKKAMLDHQKEHFQEFMQKAFDEGRKVESRRLKEGKIKSGNEADLQETDNRWKKVLEQRESDSNIRENKLREEINVLKEKVAENKAVTIEQFNKAVTDATKKYSTRPRKPPCQHLQNEVVNCYRKHPTEALRCSQQVHDFINCVEQAQVELQQSKS